MTSSTLSLLLVGTLLIPATMSDQIPQRCAAGPLADSLRPSRQGFFREVLFAAGSARTPKFDDYTEGSYHVDKLDLARGLPATAATCRVSLHALIIVGPVGPLWSYHVIAILQGTEQMRLNFLVMPHARITYKATKDVDSSEVAAFFALLEELSFVEQLQPIQSDTTTDKLREEFRHDLLAVRYDAVEEGYWRTSLQDIGPEAARSVTDAINKLLDDTRMTYEHGK